jgi:hypothetical protein
MVYEILQETARMLQDMMHAMLTTSHSGSRITSNASIKNSVRNLITELVRVTLVDGLGGEEKGRHGPLPCVCTDVISNRRYR